ncbi:MAG: tyrosine-type recombinase/integrase [Halarcobacter sp.]
MKEELIKNDLTKYIEKDRVDNERERYLTVDEINKLYEAIEDDKQLFLFCKLALTTGGRLATILNISKKDIDFSNQLINIYDLKRDQERRISYTSFLTDEVALLLKE